MTRPPWHALSVSEVRETTGATTWTLAKARMELGGWPVFEKGTFKGNRSYYFAGLVQHPDQPLWETCRAFLSGDGLCETTAPKGRFGKPSHFMRPWAFGSTSISRASRLWISCCTCSGPTPSRLPAGFRWEPQVGCPPYLRKATPSPQALRASVWAELPLP